MIKSLLYSSSNFSLRKTTGFLLFLLLTTVGLRAQVATNYSFQQIVDNPNTYANLDSSLKTILIPGSTPAVWDNSVVTTPIGFNFTFNGTVYSNVNVSSNGFITFGTTVPASTIFSPISSTATYDGVVAGYAANLSVGTILYDGTYPTIQSNCISKLVTGTAPNRTCVIEYRQVRRASTGTPINFQILLKETTNEIEVFFDATGTNLTSTTGQCGLRGSVNTDFNNLNNNVNQNWTTVVNGGANTNTSSLKISNGYTIPVTASRRFIWTPNNCVSPLTLTMSNVLINSATVNFTDPTPNPSSGYQYEIRTSGAAGSGATGLAQSGTIAVGSSPYNFTSLTANTAYTLYIRSDCGGTYGTWTSVAFTTLCNALNVPYYQDFSSATSPNLPPCTSRQAIGASPLWTTVNIPDAESNFADDHLIYNQSGTQSANVWFFTEGINLTGGNTYRISYTYGGSSVPSTVTNRLEVKYGTAPYASSMTLPIDNHPNIKGSPNVNFVTFTAPSSGVFYFGFKAYSVPAQGKIFLDDIEIVNSTCKQPGTPTASNIASTSADLNWSAPSPAPGSGYTYYITTTNPVVNASSLTVGQSYTITSVGTTDFTLYGASSNTVGTQFVATAAPIGSASLTIGQTYTINFAGTTNWVALGASSNTSGVQFVATGSGVGSGTAVPNYVGGGTGTATIVLSNNQTPTGTTAAGINVVSLSGLANNTTYYFWVRGTCGGGIYSEWSNYVSFTTLNVPPYCIPSASVSTSYFSNFTTTGGITNINNTTAFATPSGYADYTGMVVTQSVGQSINFTTTIVGPTVGVAIWVDWNNNATFEAGERMYNTGTYVSAASGSFTVPGGTPNGSYRMRVMMDYWATSPNPCSINNLFGYTRGEVEDYTFKVLPPPPPLTLSATSSSQCANVNSPLVTLTAGGPPTFNVYNWSPATGVTGDATAGWTFNATTTTVYTLTATETVSPFRVNTATYTYNATAAPTAVSVTPATATVCQSGPAQQLTSSGGIVFGSVVLDQNFESGTTGWTLLNNSGASNPPTSVPAPQPAWTVRPNGYNRPPVFTTNDASAFIFADSDAQGSGTNTDVTMISPSFSLANYSSANLSFYHYFRSYPGQTGLVDISTDGGGTWTNLLTYTGTTIGTESAFSNATFNLAAYLGQTNLMIRFKFTATWGWYWAIDNINISGTRQPQIVWNTQTAPVANGVAVPGLYTDLAGTTPYIAGTIASSVYTMPAANATYVASTNVASCSASGTTVITATPVVGGTANGTQTNCDSNSLTNITLTGHTGTVVRWEYANDAAFTIGVTPIANTTTTLTPAEFGTFYGLRYFRAVVTNGSCNNVYSSVASVNIPASTWNGSAWSPSAPDASRVAIFNGNYSSTGNLTACSVVVNSGNVVFNTNHTFTVQNSVKVNGGTFVFNDKSSLLQVNDVANAPGVYTGGNSGNISYTRVSTQVYEFDYTYWSTPVNPQTIAGFTPLSPLAYEFDAPSQQWAYANLTGNMIPAHGYIVRAPSNYPVSPAPPITFSATFTGVPNSGTITVPVSAGATSMNLLGNPYPSALSADAFLVDPANAATVGGTIYLWTHNTPIDASYQYTGSDYAVYTYLGGTGTSATNNPGLNTNVPNGKIASGQGFFIKGLVNGTATFKNSMRLAGNNDQFFRLNGQQTVSDLESHRLWLDISNAQGAFKQTLIGYVETATDGTDRLFDGELAETGNVVQLYSFINEDKMTIQGLALPFEVSDIIPLGLKSTIATTYTISLSNFDGLFENQDVYLEDKLLNVIHNLKESDYVFSTEIGTFNDRFQLRFSPVALGNPTFNASTVVVFKNDLGIYVSTGNQDINHVSIHDVTGKLIFDKNNVNNDTLQITSLPKATQVLLVTVENAQGVKVTKKVIY